MCTIIGWNVRVVRMTEVRALWGHAWCVTCVMSKRIREDQRRRRLKAREKKREIFSAENVIEDCAASMAKFVPRPTACIELQYNGLHFNYYKLTLHLSTSRVESDRDRDWNCFLYLVFIRECKRFSLFPLCNFTIRRRGRTAIPFFLILTGMDASHRRLRVFVNYR